MFVWHICDTALQNLDPFSTSGPTEPIQRDETIFNPLAQATAIRESLSQLPGVASSVFSSFSSILKGTAPQERVDDSSAEQYIKPSESSQYQCFYDQSLNAPDTQQIADIQPIAPAFYSPTDLNLVRPEATLSPSALQDSNTYRLKDRKKHYAQIPGLYSHNLNIAANVLSSPTPPLPAPSPLAQPAENIQPKSNNSTFSLTSFFGASLLDNKQNTTLPQSSETVPGISDTSNFVAPFLQQQQQPTEQFIPFIQSDAVAGTDFSQRSQASIPYAAPTTFNLSPYQQKPVQSTPEIEPLSTQLQKTHLLNHPLPAIASFNQSPSVALTPPPVAIAPPTNTAPPTVAADPSSYRLRGKPLYKKPAQQDNYNCSPYQPSPLNPSSSPFVNAAPVVLPPSALPPNVQPFSPALFGNQPQSIGQLPPQSTPSPIQLFNPDAQPIVSSIIPAFAPPIADSATSSAVPQRIEQFQPKVEDYNQQSFEERSQNIQTPIQLFNSAATSYDQLPSQTHFQQLQPESVRPQIFEAPPQTLPTPIQLFNPAAPFVEQPPPQTLFDPFQPKFESSQAKSFEASPHDTSTPIELFNPLAQECQDIRPHSSEAPPQIAPIQLFNPATVSDEQPPPQTYFEPAFEDLQAPPQSVPTPNQLFGSAEQPASQTIFERLEPEDEFTQSQLFGQVLPPKAALSPIQLFQPAAASPSPPVPNQINSDQFQQTNFGSNQLELSDTSQPPESAPSPFQLFNPIASEAEHQPQAITPVPNVDVLDLFSQNEVSTTLSGSTLPHLQSFFDQSAQSSRAIESIESTEIPQSPESFQSTASHNKQAPNQISSPILFDLATAVGDHCANLEVNQSATTPLAHWTHVDGENNRLFDNAIAFGTSNASEAITTSIEPTALFVDANANVDQQNLFNDLPPLSEVQKDEQDKNFNIIRTNLLNKRIESITSVNRTDSDNTESLSIASVIVEPASSAQSEISEYATDTTTTRSLTEPLQAQLAVSKQVCLLFVFFFCW